MKTLTLLLLLTIAASAQSPYPTFPFTVNYRGLQCVPGTCINDETIPQGWGGEIYLQGQATCLNNTFLNEAMNLSVDDCHFTAFLFEWLTIQGATTPYEDYNLQTNQWMLIWAQTLQGMEILYNTTTGQYIEVTQATILEDCFSNVPRITGSGVKPC